jgi:hypothetical protein
VPPLTVLNNGGLTGTIAPHSPFVVDPTDALLEPSGEAMFMLHLKTPGSANVLSTPIPLAGFAQP